MGEVHVDPTYFTFQHQTQTMAGLPEDLTVTHGGYPEFSGPSPTSAPGVTFVSSGLS